MEGIYAQKACPMTDDGSKPSWFSRLFDESESSCNRLPSLYELTFMGLKMCPQIRTYRCQADRSNTLQCSNTWNVHSYKEYVETKSLTLQRFSHAFLRKTISKHTSTDSSKPLNSKPQIHLSSSPPTLLDIGAYTLL